MTNPMTRVWKWLLSKPTTGQGSSTFAGWLVLLLFFGPPFCLAIGGGQMAKHGLPIWSAVIVPLALEGACLWFLALQPGMKAQTIIRTQAFHPDTIQAKTDLLQRALNDAAALSNDLQVQLRVSTEELTRIQRQAEDYKVLADVNKPLADAVSRQLGEQTAVKLAKANRISVLWAVGCTLFGAIVTLLATMFSGALTLH